MRVVILGPPGSGKGTQAAMLVEHLGVPHISTGALLRDAANQGTELGLKAKGIINKGDLVPDDIMLGIVEERLGQDDVANGFILDGYPRNVAQAKSLDEMLERLGQPVEEAIHIDVDEDVIIERIANRAKLEGRSDDTEETVRNRLRVYAEQTAPVADYYEEAGLLTRVWGHGTIDEILQRILSVLDISIQPD
ncbi:MAG: adenylate kinase [Xanthomonadales bacterium]|nr:adenylate kinase [Xanthomonadales bacterium]